MAVWIRLLLSNEQCRNESILLKGNKPTICQCLEPFKTWLSTFQILSIFKIKVIPTGKVFKTICNEMWICNNKTLLCSLLCVISVNKKFRNYAPSHINFQLITIWVPGSVISYKFIYFLSSFYHNLNSSAYTTKNKHLKIRNENISLLKINQEGHFQVDTNSYFVFFFTFYIYC